MVITKSHILSPHVTIDDTVTALTRNNANFVGLHIHNTNNKKAFVQIFNLPPEDVVLGTTKPTRSFTVPANGERDYREADWADQYPKGISYAATTTPFGNVAPTTDLEGRLFYRESC